MATKEELLSENRELRLRAQEADRMANAAKKRQEAYEQELSAAEQQIKDLTDSVSGLESELQRAQEQVEQAKAFSESHRERYIFAEEVIESQNDTMQCLLRAVPSRKREIVEQLERALRYGAEDERRYASLSKEHQLSLEKIEGLTERNMNLDEEIDRLRQDREWLVELLDNRGVEVTFDHDIQTEELEEV